MRKVSIREVQGPGLYSPLSGETVAVTGIVTGVLRRGFYIQTPDQSWDGRQSDAIFVYSPGWQPECDAMVEAIGECVDYVKHETAKPVTQLKLIEADVRGASAGSQRIEPIELTSSLLPKDNAKLAILLNALEGMLVSIAPGQTFIAPSNAHGDYVLALDSPVKDRSATRTEHGGVIAEIDNPSRWFPGFRVRNYNHAPRLNLGAKLASRVTGPLHYRADAYQLAVSQPFDVDPQFIELTKSALISEGGAMTVMTLNCFNLDPHIESEHRVSNPRLDIDDDWGEGRFHTLAQAVALQAACPDIIALQEIQDNDGAEQTTVVDASMTYQRLIEAIDQLSEVKYAWLDVPPESGADGGQPGGNIRNGFLYRTDRIEADSDSIELLGQNEACFVDSRKPLLARFIDRTTKQSLVVINVHFASKRHQASIFAPQGAGVDAKESIRIEQAQVVQRALERLRSRSDNYYVTGDFNDTEQSATLSALTAHDSYNLVLNLPPQQRYDYNHRGKLQVLMHGVVSKAMAEAGKAEYEILHGNELLGVVPGEASDKPSDHAYVMAKLTLS